MSVKEITVNDYQLRINKVLSYISNNLDKKLTLELLSSISNFSAFHFHRIFKAFVNEPIGAYILRKRLDVGASLIRYSSEPINEIALKVGYDTAASFTKAFKNRFAISPSEYRNESKDFNIDNCIIFNNNNLSILPKPKIRSVNSKNIIFIRSTGNYSGKQTGETWEILLAFVKRNKLFSWSTEMLGMSYDDPETTEDEHIRYDACITIGNKKVTTQENINQGIIEGGNFAVFQYKGAYHNLNQAYNAIFRNWLPESGMTLRNVPVFEKYVNNPNRTKPENLITEIYIPIN